MGKLNFTDCLVSFFSYMMRLKEVYNEFSKRFNFKLIGEISMKLMQKKMENYL